MARSIVILAFVLLLTSCGTNQKKTTVDGATESPKLTKPVVRKIWVSPVIEDGGKVYRDGHYKYLLENESVWSR